MQFCNPHWAALKHALLARGLGDFIPSTGAEAFERVRSAKDGMTVATFDPLLGANMAIFTNAMNTVPDPSDLVGGKRPDGTDWCPICYLIEKSGNAAFETWIDHAADDQKRIADSLNQPKTTTHDHDHD